MSGDSGPRIARVRAFAKLNLGLRVLFKRPDGYHELRTIFQTISLADRITILFERASKTLIEVEGAPGIEDNLMVRAAELVLDQMRMKARVRFRLDKIIPMGAGLGGGSSDAAAVLIALPVLAGRPVPEPRARAIALELGSDVPFFLQGGTALGMGRGEELYPLPDLSAPHVLVVSPAVHSSTAQAYGGLSNQLTIDALKTKLESFQQEVWQGTGACAANDFEPVVFARHPEVKRVRDRLRRSGAITAAMTGSGSAVFGIFHSAHSFAKAGAMFPQERVFPVSFVSRARYQSVWARALKQHSEGDQWPPQSLYAQ